MSLFFISCFAVTLSPGQKPMDTEKKQNDSSAGRSKRRTGILIWLLFIVCVLVVLLFFALPAYISSQSFRKLIVRKVNQSIGGKIEIDKLAMGWFEGVILTNFSYVDQAGRLSISVKNIFTKPSYGSFVFGKPALKQTIIEQPTMKISLAEPLLTKDKPSKADTETKKVKKLSFLPLKQIELVINQGRVQISKDTRDSQQQTLELSKINTTILLNQVEPEGFIKLQGNFDIDYDLAVLSAVAAQFLPEGIKLEGKRKESITFSTECSPDQFDRLLANLNTEFTFGFEKAEYMGLELGPTETNVKITNGLLTIAPFSTNANNGQVNFAASVDLTQSPMLLRTAGPIDMFKDIRISDKVSHKLLIYLNPIFANAVNVSGAASLRCEKLTIPLDSGNKKDLEIAGTIKVDNLRLKASELLGQIIALSGIGRSDVAITLQPTHFVLENGSLSYTNMQIDIGDNPVNFSGTIGLDGSLNMTVTLPYTVEGKIVRTGEEAKETRIQLPLKGTIKKPEINTGKLIEEQLKELVPIGVQKLLEQFIFK